MWIDESRFERGEIVAVDALGVPIDGVETAQETEDGIEAIVVAVNHDGEEHVASVDGVTFDPVRARMQVPGGQLFDMKEEYDHG